MRKLTLEDFVETSNKIYDNKFDYSKVEYISDRTPVTIICKKHGEFSQTPLTHKNGSGCPYCKAEKQKEKFIKKANIIHNNKYDYSKVVYTNNKTPVIIICHEHGEFTQRPDNHLHGAGCFRCGVELRGINQRLSTEDFITRAKEIHNNKYTYNKTIYYKTDEKVVITCPIHGDFLQTPNIHLGGCGCPKCKSEASSTREKSTKEEFIKKANAIHNNKYNYDKVNYIDGHTKVVITCPKHGDFIQKPCLHLNNKQGCPHCGYERVSKSRKGNTEDFIKKAQKKHGDKFDYSQTNYISATEMVNIICKKHGLFQQTAFVHLRCKDGGCPVCKKELFGVKNRDHLGNQFSTITDKCKFWNINKCTYTERIKLGWTEKEALTCPLKMSLGEYRIKETLDEKSFKYFYNTTLFSVFNNKNIDKKTDTENTIHKIAIKNNISSKTLSSLKYDFAIFNEENKLSFLLEFDGQQHFENSKAFFKDIDEFKYRILLDKVKTEIAQTLKIPLLRIRYDQIAEISNIIETISKNPILYIDKCNTALSNKEYWKPLDNYIENTHIKAQTSNSNYKKILCVETGEIYNGPTHAQNITGANYHTISLCCRGKRNVSGGYHWRYATEEEIQQHMKKLLDKNNT